jgi:hypothetical protein
VGRPDKERKKKMGQGPRVTVPFSYLFKKIKWFELIRSKDRLSLPGNFQIKYEIIENEIRNNFPNWKFSKF